MILYGSWKEFERGVHGKLEGNGEQGTDLFPSGGRDVLKNGGKLDGL